MSVSGRSEVQPPDPTGQPTTTKRHASVLNGSAVPVEDPAALEENVIDRAFSIADEGEVSDKDSTSPDHEELLDVDQELLAEQSKRKA